MKRVFAFAMVCLIFMQFGVFGAAQGADEQSYSLSENGSPKRMESAGENETPDGDENPPDTRDSPREDGNAPPPEDDPPVAEPEIVENISLGSDRLLIIPLNGDKQTLELQPQAYGNLVGDWMVFYVDLDWQLDRLDTSIAGWHDLIGVPVLEEGYALAEEDFTLSQRVLVYDPDQADVQEVINGHVMTLSSFIVPRGDDDGALEAFKWAYSINASGGQALEQLLARVALDAGEFTVIDGRQEDFSFFYPVTRDVSLVDMQTVGSYYPFSGPPSYFWMSEAARQEMAIHVIEPDEVDLRGWFVDGFSSVHIDWFHQIEQPALWVSVDGESWQNADLLMEQGLTVPVQVESDDDWDFDGLSIEDNEASGSEDDGPELLLIPPYSFKQDWRTGRYNGLQIIENLLVTGHTYEFEIRYENEGFSVNSFLLDLTEGIHPRWGNGGGSRGGSDRDETDPPPVNPGGGSSGSVEPDDDVSDPVVPQPVPSAPIEPEEQMPAPTDSEEEMIEMVEPENQTPDPAIAEKETSSPENEVVLVHLPVTPGSTKSIVSRDNLQQNESVPDPVQPPSGDTEHPLQAEDEDSAEDQPANVPESSVPPTFPSEAADIDTQNPTSGLASIAIVGGSSALGAAVIWKLLGKKLVKRR